MMELIVVHQFGGDRVMRRPTARKSEASSLFVDVLIASLRGWVG